jgi:glyoxylase-like metal-dependent hydrolase (beta-lactamase superfamily II)
MDGGAAFGVVPRSLWQKFCPPDENNMIEVTTRCLLVEQDDRLILFDAGMGRKRDDKYYSYRYLSPRVSLGDSFKEAGYTFGEVTDVVFTHLHDDHCGGAIALQGGVPVPVFPNAMHWCSSSQLDWALHPNKREAGTFFSDNILPLLESGRMKTIEREGEFTEGISFRIFDGHTRGQIIPFFDTGKGIFVFAGDFIPTSAHLPLPYIASVDIEPLTALKEKEEFLEEALRQGFILIFEHDPLQECCTLAATDKGIRAGRFCLLGDFFK